MAPVLSLIPALLIDIMLSTTTVAAADVSGTWVTNSTGDGYAMAASSFTHEYDLKLVPAQEGDGVSGAMCGTVTCPHVSPSGQSDGCQKLPVGQKSELAVHGTISRNAPTLYDPSSYGQASGDQSVHALQPDGDLPGGSGSTVRDGVPYQTCST